MRWIVLGIGLFVAGCSSNTDLFTGYQNSFTSLSSGFKADDALKVDLAKDFHRKSEQLEFISRQTYSCGYAADRNRIESVLHPPKDNKKSPMQKKADEVTQTTLVRLRGKIKQLDTIIGYGETLAAVQKDSATFQAYLNAAQTSVSNYSKLVATPQATLLATAMTAALGLLSDANKYGDALKVIAAAKQVNSKLRTSVNEIKRDKLPDLTADETLIFALWNGCSIERLNYIRDRYPTGPRTSPNSPKVYMVGMTTTPVMDFANAYGVYIAEREAFLARRPDYASLLDGIVEANQKIVDSETDPSKIWEAVNAAGDAAATATAKTEAYRKAMDAYEEHR